MDHVLFVPPSADGHLSCFCLLSVVNNAALCIQAQVLGVDTCFHFLGVEIGEEREFPDGPVVRTWRFHCHDLSSTPGRGTEILQATCCGQNFFKKLRRRIRLGFVMAFWQL